KREDTLRIIKNVRSVSDKIPFLLDTKGPEIRTTEAEQPIHLKKGDIIKIRSCPDQFTTEKCIQVNYPGFVDEIPQNSKILIDDGYLELQVGKKEKESLTCVVKNEGILKSRKSVNVPGVCFSLPGLSEKDRDYIQFAIEQDIDFIAHSFVRHKNDVIDIQKILDQYDSKIKIIAKIENREGVNNIDEILEHVYGIMVARGDLAIEIPYEKIPGIQKMIINKCIANRKPVIIATQMLHSMITEPRPTRAEVSDIANAIYSKTDAIMLSGETAHGQYPEEAVSTMAKVAREVEKTRSDLHEAPVKVLSSEISAYLTKSAVEASIKLNAKVIVADTVSGRTIRNMAAYRGRKPILAMCYDKRIARELALSFGVYPDYVEPTKNSWKSVIKGLKRYLDKKKLKEQDLVVVVAGNFGISHGASFVEISTLENLMGS
ncbi:MAG: pyruvate kinase, partial [Bacteroidales bacterium]